MEHGSTSADFCGDVKMKYVCNDCGAVRTKSGINKVVECFECEGHATAVGYVPPSTPEYMVRTKEFKAKLKKGKQNETQTDAEGRDD